MKALYRYPVKSMAAERLDSASLGWHGVDGDRRFAFVREGQRGGFPWLTGRTVPSLVLYQPFSSASESGQTSPTHVRTPRGEAFELWGEPLRRELSAAHGGEVRLVQLDRGTFDEAPVSLISTRTVLAIGEAAGRPLDARRFRPNVLVETADEAAFPEDQWVGRILALGTGVDAPRVTVMKRDARCVMINLDPETAMLGPEVLKGTVRANQTCAGVYGSTFKPGTLSVGDPVYVVEV